MKILFAGIIARYPFGGVTWCSLMYLMGLRALGHDVFYVEDTGEVKWILSWALDQDIPTPVISESQQALMEYRDSDWPAAKAVALLRHGYGGHPVHMREKR